MSEAPATVVFEGYMTKRAVSSCTEIQDETTPKTNIDKTRSCLVVIGKDVILF